MHHPNHFQSFPSLDLDPIQSSIQVESCGNEGNVRKCLWGVLKSRISFFYAPLSRGITHAEPLSSPADFFAV
jgi:hypothetical protein